MADIADSTFGKSSGTPNADPLKEDFRNFLYVTWKHLNLPDPTPVQYDIARWLQHGPRRKMVQAFRGVGKSWIYAAFVCWRLYCNPDWKIMVVSASKALADDFSKFVKSLIYDMPILRHLRAKKGQRDTNISFDVGPARSSKDPSVKSVGITGQITGSRADEILADDIESLNNSATEGSREKLSEQVKEFDAVIKPGGTITYLGTPQTIMSMYSKLPERGYTVRIWTARVPAREDIYKGCLSDYVRRLMAKGIAAGSPVDPARFSDEDLQEREMSYKAAGFQLQFMLNTSNSDLLRFPLKLSDLLIMDIDHQYGPQRVVWGRETDRVIENVHNFGLPGDRYYSPMSISQETGEFTGSIMAIDPSGRGKDETAWAIAKHLNGLVFVPEVGGMQGGYEDNVLSTLALKAKTYGVNLILVEANFGGGMFAKLLQPHLTKIGHKCTVEEVNSTGQKEARILDVLEPIMAQHRLVMDKGLINRDFESAQESQIYALFYQLTRLTRERGALGHDDRLDALSMAVAYWVEQMAQDNSKGAEKAAEALLQQELKDFMKHTVGRKPKRKGWL